MTNQVAIRLLNQIRHILLNSNSWLPETHNPINEAFDMAIKALDQPEPSNDEIGCSNCMYSGRPTYKSPCSECRDNSQWEMKPISRSHENGTECEDTISRQAVYDALMAEPLKWDDSSVWESARCYQWMMDMDAIKALPSAQPEIVRCKDCLMHGSCRFEQGLGLDGYCSQAERRTDGGLNQQEGSN